jgi:SAM-dependent methyltransferase
MESTERRVTDEGVRRPGAAEPRPDDTAHLSGLAVLHERIARAFTGRRVLELGCGVGAWTRAYAARAKQVTAVDGREELLALARAERYPPGRVEFVRADYTALPDFGRRHDALFAAKRWSRIPAERLDAFLRQAVNAVAPGALVAFLDERGAAGAPSESDLIRHASRCGWGANVELLPSYWLLTWWAAH